MFFLQQYKQYIKQRALINVNDISQAVANETANICLLNDLRQGVETDENKSHIYIYDIGKTTNRYKRHINTIKYNEWKNGIRHGISFTFNINLNYPGYFATFKNGILDGYYFHALNLDLLFLDSYPAITRHYPCVYAISATYENGYTSHIGCMGFDFMATNLHFYKRYKIRIPYPCDKIIYQNIFKTHSHFDGWQKSGNNYTFYENDKMVKTATGDCTEYQVFAHEYVTYDYDVSEDKIMLEICVDRDRLYKLAFGQADQFDDIKDITDGAITVAQYIWYRNKPVIIMRRSISPNYCSYATYELIKLYDKVGGVWTRIEYTEK